MQPISIEEEIVSFADKFFSKDRGSVSQEKDIDEIKAGLSKFGNHKVKIFESRMVKY
jgi:uncharacterized protein